MSSVINPVQQAPAVPKPLQTQLNSQAPAAPKSAVQISEDAEVRQLRQQLESHRLYTSIDTREALCRFMEHHVFAVWDFMCLLKSLQRDMTCVTVPWTPRDDANLAHFVNEMVIDEESDCDAAGTRCSHYEMYLDAMQDAGADTGPVRQFVKLVSQGVPIDEALVQANAPVAVRSFVAIDCDLAQLGGIEPAAAFTFGREDLIPTMFTSIVGELVARNCSSMPAFEKFVFYLERHIEIDGDSHGPLSLQLVDRVCNGETSSFLKAKKAACEALKRRIKLWDDVADVIRESAE